MSLQCCTWVHGDTLTRLQGTTRSCFAAFGPVMGDLGGASAQWMPTKAALCARNWGWPRCQPPACQMPRTPAHLPRAAWLSLASWATVWIFRLAANGNSKEAWRSAKRLCGGRPAPERGSISPGCFSSWTSNLELGTRNTALSGGVSASSPSIAPPRG